MPHMSMKRGVGLGYGQNPSASTPIGRYEQGRPVMRAIASIRAVHADEDVIESLEELDQVNRELRVPRLAEVADGEGRLLAPALERVQRKQLVGVIEHRQEQLVLLLELVPAPGGSQRLRHLGGAREVPRQLVDLSRDLQPFMLVGRATSAPETSATTSSNS